MAAGAPRCLYLRFCVPAHAYASGVDGLRDGPSVRRVVRNQTTGFPAGEAAKRSSRRQPAVTTGAGPAAAGHGVRFAYANQRPPVRTGRRQPTCGMARHKRTQCIARCIVRHPPPGAGSPIRQSVKRMTCAPLTLGLERPRRLPLFRSRDLRIRRYVSSEAQQDSSRSTLCRNTTSAGYGGAPKGVVRVPRPLRLEGITGTAGRAAIARRLVAGRSRRKE